MNPRVAILTAGVGSRLSERTKYFNKGCLRVGNKATISHTIDEFPDDIEFVIGLGYKGNIVKQYLEIAHPEKRFIFVEIDKYSEAGAGPGYALLKCKEYLQCPFYFVSCDSIISWRSVSLPSMIKDGPSWAAYSKIDFADREKYCTVQVNDYGDKITNVFDKSKDGTENAFVGVAFIKEFNEFWSLMEQEKPSVGEEIQVAPVILGLSSIRAELVKWYDTGSEVGLQKAREEFAGIQNLDKLDEELYVVNNHVIKYFHNSNTVKNRLLRANKLNKVIPDIKAHSNNFYKYEFIDGQDLFKVDNQHEIINNLLSYTYKFLWSDIKNLDDYEKIIFKDACKKFYYDKTLSRLEKLYRKINIKEKDNIINGITIPSLDIIFKKINWDYIAAGIPANGHGDFNFSNIILTKNGEFKFLDWRQDFSGFIDYMDIYYDFAKMYHSFLFPHSSVKENKFYIKKHNNGKIKTFIEVPINIEKSKDVFEDFIIEKEYDLWKIKILTCLVLLNMSPLHESPIDVYLYYYGKYYLYEVLKENV